MKVDSDETIVADVSKEVTSLLSLDKRASLESLLDTALHVRDFLGQPTEDIQVEGSTLHTTAAIPDADKSAAGTASKDSRQSRPLLPPASYSPRPSSSQIFVAIRKWEGTVIDVRKDTFYAHLRDLAGGRNEEAEFPIADIGFDDRQLLQEGAKFIFSVGYLTSLAGTVYRRSCIRLRRLPNWSADEILDAHKEAQELLGRLHIDELTS